MNREARSSPRSSWMTTQARSPVRLWSWALEAHRVPSPFPSTHPTGNAFPEWRRGLGTRTPCWPTRTTDVTGITTSQHAATEGGWATGPIALTGPPASLGRRNESVPDRRLQAANTAAYLTIGEGSTVMDRSARMTAMDAKLEAALAPVVTDLTSTTSLTPEFEDMDWPLNGMVGTLLVLPNAGGAGISITRGAGRTDQVVSLADQVQEWVVEALWGSGRAPVWPERPEHPDSHPLRPAARSGAAIWACPSSQDEIGPIGTLTSESRP
jgi:hypothetical protein